MVARLDNAPLYQRVYVTSGTVNKYTPLMQKVCSGGIGEQYPGAPVYICTISLS